MNQGQYEYLHITVKIDRKDSLFVKNVTVKPSLRNGSFYPVFSHYSMFSYYTGPQDKTGYKGMKQGDNYWDEYHAREFDQLPADNRKTNYGDALITYSVTYNSEQINFENFSANIEVTLADNSGKTIVHRSHFDFSGKRQCHFSAH